MINVVEKDGLLRLMEWSGELGLRSALAVSRKFQRCYPDIHDFVLSRSCLGKVARLLLSRIRSGIDGSNEVRIQAPFTHQETAQRIGVSRESVSRSLSELRKRSDQARRFDLDHQEPDRTGIDGGVRSFE